MYVLRVIRYRITKGEVVFILLGHFDDFFTFLYHLVYTIGISLTLRFCSSQQIELWK